MAAPQDSKQVTNYEKRDVEDDCADSDFDSDCTGDDAGSDVVYVKRGEDGHQKWCPFFAPDRNLAVRCKIYTQHFVK